MKTIPPILCVVCLLCAISYAGDKDQVVIVAADGPQKTEQNAAAGRAAKLAALQKWAADNLVLADREIQLRSALAAKLYQQKGNRPFTLSEWQLFDQVTKWCIILGCPQAIPPELLG